jgi:hypothetical protein
MPREELVLEMYTDQAGHRMTWHWEGQKRCGLPGAVTLGGRYRMSPRGQRTFEGSTSPQARFILEHLVRLAREHAGPVP